MKSLFSGSGPRWIALASTLALLVISALLPATAFAAGPEGQPKCATNDVKCVITYGDTLIVKRQRSLNALNTKTTVDLNNHEITDSQASVLKADVAAAQASLIDYKKRLDAETNVPSARQDLSDLWTQLRIYAVVLPRDYRTLNLDHQINAETLMQNIAPVIQAGLTYAPNDKQSQLNTLYNDYTKQLADAQPQIQTVQGALPAFTVANYNQHRADFQTSKDTTDKALKAGSTALFKAADDLKQMAKLLGLQV